MKQRLAGGFERANYQDWIVEGPCLDREPAQDFQGPVFAFEKLEMALCLCRALLSPFEATSAPILGVYLRMGEKKETYLPQIW